MSTPAVGTDALELVDDGAKSAVTVVPSRGAIVTRFRVGERELLFLDASTLADRTKNVRGGVPVLFPSPGKLTGDRFEYGGKSGAMKQHGFARDAAWTVAESSASRARLTLESSDATRAAFPWDFAVAIDLSLRGTCLRFDVTVRNTGRDPMPFAFGLHPYFLVANADKARTRIDTRATRAFDNVTKSEGPFEGFDLTRPEVDLHLVDHGSTASALHLADGGRIDVRASSDLKRWVVWTLAGRDFVCLEPWTAPADALNTRQSVLAIAPQAAHTLWIELVYVAP